MDAPQQLSGAVLIVDSSNGAVFRLPLQAGLKFDSEDSLAISWMLPDETADGTLTLFNSSNQPIQVSPTMANGAAGGQAITLAGHETRKIGLRQMLTANGEALRNSSGLFNLRYSGPPHALISSLLISGGNGFALSPSVNATHVQRADDQTIWHFPDIALKENQQLGASDVGPLTAYALLSNTSSLRMTPDLSVSFGAVAGRQTAKASLPSMTLEPGETRLLRISDFVDTGLIPAAISHISLTVSHPGEPGDLGITVFTTDPTGAVTAQPAGFLQPHNALDASFWSVEKPLGLPVVKNKTSQPVRARMRLFFQTDAGVRWFDLPMLKLGARRSAIVGIRTALRAGVPDENGNTVPSGTVRGIITVSDADQSAEEDRSISAECLNDQDCATASLGANAKPQARPATPAVSPSPSAASSPKAIQFAALVCGPEVDGISPPSGSLDTFVDVELTGPINSFTDSDTVSVTGGITATVTDVSLDGDVLFATFEIPETAFTGPQDVVVTDIELGDSNPVTFTVGDASPVITGVSPDTWSADATTSFAIFGFGFGTDPTLTISGTGITSYSILGASDTEIDASVTIDPNAPSGTASITVVSNGYFGSGFQPTDPGAPDQSSAGANIQTVAAPVPHIVLGTSTGSCGGTNVAGSTQNIIVGQQVAVVGCVTLPPNLTIQSQSWSTPGGTTIGGYTASTAGGSVTPLQSLTGATLAFYWVDAANGRGLTYHYTMSNGQSNSASVTFNVSGPSGVSLGVTPGTVNISNSPTPRMVLGGGSPNLGIRFAVTGGTLPAGNSGAYSFVQLVANDQHTELMHFGIMNCVYTGFITDPKAELDNTYPYALAPGSTNSTNDNPAIVFDQSLGELQRSFSATMYLLWTPTAAGGCTGTACTVPVPLGSVPWHFSGDSINTLSTLTGENSTTWRLSCGNPPSSAAFQAGSTYPTWTTTFMNSGNYTCQ